MKCKVFQNIPLIVYIYLYDWSLDPPLLSPSDVQALSTHTVKTSAQLSCSIHDKVPRWNREKHYCGTSCLRFCFSLLLFFICNLTFTWQGIILKSIVKMNCTFVTNGAFLCGWKKNTITREGQREKTRERCPLLCPLSACRQNCPGKLEVENREMHFQPESLRALSGPKCHQKHGGSVSQHFQNGSGWQSIDITHDENRTSLTFWRWPVCVCACTCGLILTDSKWSSSVQWLWVLLNDCCPPLLLTVTVTAEEREWVKTVLTSSFGATMDHGCIVKAIARSDNPSENCDAALYSTQLSRAT